MAKPVTFCALAIIALSLHGCVAAVIPLAAAGAMGSAVRGKTDAASVASSDRGEAPTETAVASTSDAAMPSARMAPNTVDTVLVPNSPGTGRAAGTGTGAEIFEVTSLTELPAPTAARSDPARDSTYTAFADYALGVAALDPLADKLRQSALLARPGTLVADRAPCRFVGNAVLIDLDPVRGEFDTGAPISRPALARALARLREADVEIVWGTALTADRAGDVRKWLVNSELDPQRQDRLLLLRYPEDRKQTRREEASAERCLIAMLGDERADFDELFDYLKRPEAAIGLDAMLGKGWFLAPVSQATPMTEGLEE